MTTNRYAFTDTMYNKSKIYTNSAQREYNRIKADNAKKQTNYFIALDEYNSFKNAKLRDRYYNNQLLELEKVMIGYKKEFDASQQELKNVERELKNAQLREPINFKGYQVKGFLDKTFINKFLDGTEATGQIMQGMAFRPDKVSMFYYGNVHLYWVLSLVNNLEGIQDWIEGKEILVPSLNTIKIVLGG